MCSILGIFNIQEEELKQMRHRIRELSGLQRHRGPDWSGYHTAKTAVFAHERLSIVGLDSGSQPLYSANKKRVLVVNGEIYNYEQLKKEYSEFDYQTDSDCEVILAMYENYLANKPKEIPALIGELRGMFSFIIYDEELDYYLIARDHMGIIPLYYAYDSLGHMLVASEMKSLVDECKSLAVFPAGHYLESSNKELVNYYKPSWLNFSKLKFSASKLDRSEQLRLALEDSVHSHLMSDVPYGVLLSGGLDSSIISAVTQKYARKRIEDNDSKEAWWPRLHSFAIGLESAPDLVAAARVAKAIGTVHHEFHFTVEEGLDVLSDVIYHIETFDVTTIRASVPMFLLARKIKSMGVKMVLSGEGADEIFGGYLYFHGAPNAQEFHAETVLKLQRLQYYDCLRANKAMAAWGVEVRVPFLDKKFMDLAMNLNVEQKMTAYAEPKIEKRILRQAFTGYLPETVLWRQKEQFSDGVGYSWIDSLKQHAEEEITDEELATAHLRFPLNTPNNKEAYYYRILFEKRFPENSAVATVPVFKSIACSTEVAFKWFANASDDPSGRAAVAIHKDSY